MEHDRARNLATLSLDTHLGAEDERDLALHHVTCPPCKAHFLKLTELRSAWATMKVHPPTELVADVVERSVAVLDGHPDPKSIEKGEGDVQALHTVPVPDAVPATQDTVPAQASPDTAHAPQPPQAPVAPPVKVPPPAPAEPSPVPLQGYEPPSEPLPTPAVAWDSPTATLPPLPVTRDASPDTPIGVPDSAQPTVHRIDSTLTERPPFAPLQLEEQEDPQGRRSIGSALILVLVALITAGAAWFLLSRTSSGPKEDPLPDAQVVVSKTIEAFEGIESLSADFDIARLDLYRYGDADKPRTTFAVGRLTGTTLYDGAGNLREEATFTLQEVPPITTTTIRSAGSVTSYVQRADGRALAIDTRPAFGPPDGSHLGRLGLLERSVGSTVNAMQTATDFTVASIEKLGDGEAVRAIFTVKPDEIIRADRIVVYLDANTYMPLRIEKSIERRNARVLGPETILTEENLNTSFGDESRVVTESVSLTDVDINGSGVAASDFTFEVPEGVESTPQDSGFEPTEISDAPSFVGLPDGYDVVAAIAQSEPKDWGPGKKIDAPASADQYAFFNGRSTVVADVRAYELKDEKGKVVKLPAIPSPPFEVGSFTLVTQTVTIGEFNFTFATSPQIAPVMFGKTENSYITVSGWVTVDVLSAIVESIINSNGSPEVSPTPSSSPTATNPTSDSAVSDNDQRKSVDPTDEQNPNIP